MSALPFWWENHCACTEELPKFVCIPADLLFLISNILYNRTRGRSICVWVTKDDPPKGGGNHIHIGYTSNVVFHDTAGAHTGHSWGKPHRQST